MFSCNYTLMIKDLNIKTAKDLKCQHTNEDMDTSGKGNIIIMFITVGENLDNI